MGRRVKQNDRRAHFGTPLAAKLSFPKPNKSLDNAGALHYI
jgi:hypothetical protein